MFKDILFGYIDLSNVTQTYQSKLCMTTYVCMHMCGNEQRAEGRGPLPGLFFLCNEL